MSSTAQLKAGQKGGANGQATKVTYRVNQKKLGSLWEKSFGGVKIPAATLHNVIQGSYSVSIVVAVG